ncbi:MAG: hypothetical protein QOC82_252 [Frankiaceae bacterium]|jgi:hypothetical protein|nr:hypothetical protein [Frankiaceae bacterium]
MRRFALFTAIATCALALSATPADAATWSSRSLGHTPFTCSDKSLWVKHYINAGATIYAAATDKCGHYSFVSGNPTAGYHIERTPFAGYNGMVDNVDAIARDGATTWFLRRNPQYAGHLEIWTRSSTGKYSLFRLLSSTATVAQSTHPADLTVSGGNWTAAWIQLVNGVPAIYLNSTLAGHAGHAQAVTPKPAGFGNLDPYVVQRSSTDAEVMYRSVGSSDAAALHVRHVVQGGFSADRVMVKVTGQLVMIGRVLQRGASTFFLFNDYLDASRTHALGLITDTGSAAHSTTVATGNYYGQLAVDAVSGHLFAVADLFQTGTYPSLLSNSTGTWRSSRLPVGTSDIGFDALTAYSSNLAVYYSPAGTPQDTVYYSH